MLRTKDLIKISIFIFIVLTSCLVVSQTFIYLFKISHCMSSEGIYGELTTEQCIRIIHGIN